MPRAWTDEQLKAAVAQARCVADVLRALGLKNPKTVLARAAALGLQIPKGRRPSWSDDDLRAAVAESKTVREALKRLNVQGRGDNYKTFHKHVRRLGIDTSHFAGSGHLRGQSRLNLASRRSLDVILVENSEYENTKTLSQRLLREGVLERRCYECEGTEWRGQPMPLELDHINGNRRDNRRENLRFLCPNCHALTSTFRGRNATAEMRASRPRLA
ncbi:MAG TPA: HNH endonuclease signature motif containing protein [Longimicrobium sp.]|nr:HNH endonuclease signature motif containing protein [Longimicrobium sp.]